MAGEKKVYLRCSAKAKETSFGTVLKLSFKDVDIAAFVREHKNDKGYINLEIRERKEVGQYGDTHSVSLDTWKPTPRDTGAHHSDPLTDSDIPF